MNTEEIKDWSMAGAAFLGFAREAISLLPTSQNREQAESALVKAEREFKHAEAGIAAKLGFELCLRCWPPEIMLMNAENVSVCRACGFSDSGDENKISSKD